MTQRTDEARAKQAKGSVKEAIGKIIGDPDVERQGRRESKAGAEQARAKRTVKKDGAD